MDFFDVEKQLRVLAAHYSYLSLEYMTEKSGCVNIYTLFYYKCFCVRLCLTGKKEAISKLFILQRTEYLCQIFGQLKHFQGRQLSKSACVSLLKRGLL